MDEKQQKLHLALEKNLQKAFKITGPHLGSVESVLNETAGIVSSLANMLEQYESCRNVDQNQVPFKSDFPDLKLKVMLKLSTEISVKQDELRKKLYTLKEMEEKLSKYHKTSVGIISQGIGLTTIMTGTPTSLPLADMVDWLEVLSTKMYEHYYCKLHLLDEMMVDDSISSGTLLQRWTDQDSAFVNTIKDCLTYVGPFLEEKG